MNSNDFDTSQKYKIKSSECTQIKRKQISRVYTTDFYIEMCSVHSLDSQEICLRFIWVHSEDLILYFSEVSKSLEFITF